MTTLMESHVRQTRGLSRQRAKIIHAEAGRVGQAGAGRWRDCIAALEHYVALPADAHRNCGGKELDDYLSAADRAAGAAEGFDGLCGAAFVSMVETADLRNRDDVPCSEPTCGLALRRVNSSRSAFLSSCSLPAVSSAPSLQPLVKANRTGACMSLGSPAEIIPFNAFSNAVGNSTESLARRTPS